MVNEELGLPSLESVMFERSPRYDKEWHQTLFAGKHSRDKNQKSLKLELVRIVHQENQD